VEALREELRSGQARRSVMLAAGALFLGGVAWLSLATPPAWFGWLLLAAGGGTMLARLWSRG